MYAKFEEDLSTKTFLQRLKGGEGHIPKKSLSSFLILINSTINKDKNLLLETSFKFFISDNLFLLFFLHPTVSVLTFT